MSFISPLKVLSIVQEHDHWMDWEPETIWHELQDHFHTNDSSNEIPRLVKDMILAIKLCLTNTMPWDHWHIFDKVIMTFNNEIPNFEVMQKPSLGEITLGVEAMNKIKANIFSEEIQNYIAIVAREDGYLVLPEVLSFAQEKLDLYTPDVADKRQAVALAWRILKVKNELNVLNDDNMVSVQVAKLLSIDKYVKQNLPDK